MEKNEKLNFELLELTTKFENSTNCFLNNQSKINEENKILRSTVTEICLANDLLKARIEEIEKSLEIGFDKLLENKLNDQENEELQVFKIENMILKKEIYRLQNDINCKNKDLQKKILTASLMKQKEKLISTVKIPECPSTLSVEKKEKIAEIAKKISTIYMKELSRSSICINKPPEADEASIVNKSVNIKTGNTNNLIKMLKSKMENKLKFENSA